MKRVFFLFGGFKRIKDEYKSIYNRGERKFPLFFGG
jgi:hypothetical protein